MSTWLSAGVDATQVAAWAGHSVAVLMRVYTYTLDDHEHFTRRRIEEVLGPTEEP